MKPFHLIATSILVAANSLHAAPPDVRDISIHQLADRRVIIKRAPGIILPDPTEPVVRPVPEPKSAEHLAEIAAEWQAQRISHPTIHAGATVYRLPDGETVTHVSNWSVNNSKPVSFWSSADFSLIAHPGGFTHPAPDGDVSYTMLLFWGLHDINMREELMAKHDHEYEYPVIPDFANGPATWILDDSEKSQNLDAITERAIAHIHEFHNTNLTELKQAYAIIEAERAAHRAELEANPPQPRDIQLRVSRLTPAQAAAWHQHAVEAKGGRQ